MYNLTCIGLWKSRQILLFANLALAYYFPHFEVYLSFPSYFSLLWYGEISVLVWKNRHFDLRFEGLLQTKRPVCTDCVAWKWLKQSKTGRRGAVGGRGWAACFLHTFWCVAIRWRPPWPKAKLTSGGFPHRLATGPSEGSSLLSSWEILISIKPGARVIFADTCLKLVTVFLCLNPS